MRKVILFIATSLDGFIARKDDSINWLFSDQDYGYKAFYDSIDTTLTGHATYKQTKTFGEFAFPGKTNYIFSRSPQPPDSHPVTFISSDIVEFVRNLKNQNGKNIWLVGGGQINTVMLNAGLIDEMIVSIHPIILGEGLPLFAGKPKETKFKVTAQKTFESGLVQITYCKL